MFIFVSEGWKSGPKEKNRPYSAPIVLTSHFCRFILLTITATLLVVYMYFRFFPMSTSPELMNVTHFLKTRALKFAVLCFYKESRIPGIISHDNEETKLIWGIFELDSPATSFFGRFQMAFDEFLSCKVSRFNLTISM